MSEQFYKLHAVSQDAPPDHVTDLCLAYHFSNNSWTEQTSWPMPYAFSVAGHFYHPDWGLIVTGGFNNYAGVAHDGAFYTLNGADWIPLGAALPRNSINHCMAAIDDDRLAIAGPSPGVPGSPRVELWLYRKSTRSWDASLPAYSNRRQFAFCGSADSPDHTGRYASCRVSIA